MRLVAYAYAFAFTLALAALSPAAAEVAGTSWGMTPAQVKEKLAGNDSVRESDESQPR